MRVLAIDPGPKMSAYVVYDETDGLLEHAKVPNDEMRVRVRHSQESRMVIEEVVSYGKPVGADVFTTVRWTGRFMEAWDSRNPLWEESALMSRRPVKMFLCNAANAKDSYIRQRLIDLFGPGKAAAIGLKKTPGPLYGVKADEWQALALAVTYMETVLHIGVPKF